MISLMKKGSVLILLLCCGFACQQKTQRIISAYTGSVKNMLGEDINLDSLEHFLTMNMEAQEVPGISLAIINDGRVVYHQVKGYADRARQKKVDHQTIFEGASLSKPLFASLVMKLVEKGKLDLDQPLHQYLPYEDLAHDERYQKITARMVLCHTTGLPNWRTDADDGQLVLKFDPGTAFNYSGEAYEYLAKVVAHLEHTNNSGLEALYQKWIAKPLGLRWTKFIQDDYNLQHKALGYKNGEITRGSDDPAVFGAAYSVHSEALDFSKWVISLMEQKIWSEESSQALLEEQVELPSDSPYRTEGISHWTLGFAKASLPGGEVYGHGGNNPGYTSIFVFQPDTKWGLVLFTNADQSRLPIQLLLHLNT